MKKFSMSWYSTTDHEVASEHFRKIEQVKKGSWPDKSWCGEITNCEVCSKPMGTETYMIDGPIIRKPIPMWANLCVVCAYELCPDIGSGKAQLYKMSPDKEWLLIAGG